MKAIFQNMRVPLSVALTIALLSSGPVQAQSSGTPPDCYVVSAGVDNYPNEKKLSGCLNDARNTANAFAAQKGKLFGKVVTRTLLDGQATRAAILQHFNGFERQGKPGDFYVLFLSGHGGRFQNTRQWYFVPFDFHPKNVDNTILTDKQILDAADVVIRQRKKVIVIIDACFSGQVNATAKKYFNRYQDPEGGALILMLSSSAEQESAALGQYSAFAKAFADGMAGAADLQKTGKINLEEIRTYTRNRTHELIRQHKSSLKQDTIVSWSPGVSGAMIVAATKPIASVVPAQATVWVGSETLGGYGSLTLHMHPGGKAVMMDAKSTSQGTWEQKGKQIILRFHDGKVVYTGELSQTTLSGTAQNLKTSWKFSVQLQSGPNSIK